MEACCDFDFVPCVGYAGFDVFEHGEDNAPMARAFDFVPDAGAAGWDGLGVVEVGIDGHVETWAVGFFEVMPDTVPEHRNASITDGTISAFFDETFVDGSHVGCSANMVLRSSTLSHKPLTAKHPLHYAGSSFQMATASVSGTCVFDANDRHIGM